MQKRQNKKQKKTLQNLRARFDHTPNLAPRLVERALIILAAVAAMLQVARVNGGDEIKGVRLDERAKLVFIFLQRVQIQFLPS